MGATALLAISILTSLSSVVPSHARFDQVSCAVMQYATTLLLSPVHFGEPQKLPCCVMRFNPLPSGWTMYTSTRCSRSQRPIARGRSLSRSEEKAIHFPSGDHAGRKSPPCPEVSGL